MLERLNTQQIATEIQNLRTKKGMRQEDLAATLGVARTTMIAIEKGERKLKPKEIIELAKIFNISVHDLVRKRPSIERMAIEFRRLSSRNADAASTEKELTELQQQVEEFIRNYLELEELTQSPLVQRYPDVYLIGNATGATVDFLAEHVAQSERLRLGLGDSPVKNLRSILEDVVGIRVFAMNIPGKISGMYLYIKAQPKNTASIIINANHPPERNLITLAHEYGHFLNNREESVFDEESGGSSSSLVERFSDRFSVHFTMPRQAVLARFMDVIQEKNGFTVADLMVMAHYFGVSVTAMAMRLMELHKIKSATLEGIKKSGMKIREQQRNLGIEYDMSLVQNLPHRYKTLALQAYNDGLITESECVKFLAMPLLKFRELAIDMQSEVTPEQSDITEWEGV